jgi:hypothetical protein
VRARALLAFDASAVAGAVVARFFGRARLRGFARVPLAAGALAPSATEPNVRSSAEVAPAVRRVAREAGFGRAPVTVIAPHGAARLLLLSAPDGVDLGEFARYRLGDLPYPSPEAVIDVVSAPGGRAVAAAIRQSVVEDYEKVVAEAGLRQERLDLAPLAALGPLLADRPADGLVVDVILGDTAFTIAAHREGELLVLRHRLRDAADGEADRLRAEAERTAALAGGVPSAVRIVGSGSRALRRDWIAAAPAAAPAWEAGRGAPVEAAEAPWLGAVLA